MLFRLQSGWYSRHWQFWRWFEAWYFKPGQIICDLNPNPKEGGIQLQNLWVGDLDAWQAVTSPQAGPPRSLSTSVSYCSFGFIIQFSHCLSHCLQRCLGWKSFIMPLSKWYHIFSKPCIPWSLKVDDKISLSFLGHWFCMVVGPLQMVCFFSYLSASPSTFYLFESLPKQEINSLKKNQSLFFIWLSFLGFRFPTTGRTVPERKIV